MSDLQGKKVFVTGGAGFIGSHIVDSLLAQGAEVTVYDNMSTGHPDNLKDAMSRIRFVEGDILHPKALIRAMLGHDLVSHHAAQLEITKCIDDPVDDLTTNTIGTLNVFDAARKAGIKRVVYASSAGVYGQAKSALQSETDPTEPQWSYGVSKLATEKYAQIFADDYGMKLIGLRYGIVYGPREWFGRVMTCLLKRVLEGKPPVVFGKGMQVRDWIYVGDVVECHNRCLTAAGLAPSVALNVSTGVGCTVADLAALVCLVTRSGMKPSLEEIRPGERSVELGGRIRLPAELQRLVQNPLRAYNLLDQWKPLVSLAEGIEAEWEWLKANPERWSWDTLRL